MIRSRKGWGSLLMEGLVEMSGRHNFCLSGLLVEDRAGQGFVDVETRPSESFDMVFDSVVSDVCEYGLIPIENSLAGSINQNYDLLLRHDLHIVGEYPLRVQHCLIVLPGVKKEGIKKAISHPQALG